MMDLIGGFNMGQYKIMVADDESRIRSLLRDFLLKEDYDVVEAADGKEAIDAIKCAGGVPVWAHPLGGEGEKHISQSDFLQKLSTMINLGIQGLECYYSRYTHEEIEFLVKTAKENNLYITGGSDYHGKNKDIPLGKLNSDNTPIDQKFLSILR